MKKIFIAISVVLLSLIIFAFSLCCEGLKSFDFNVFLVLVSIGMFIGFITIAFCILIVKATTKLKSYAQDNDDRHKQTQEMMLEAYEKTKSMGKEL